MATTFITQHAHEFLEDEQEAINRVLTGTALIAYTNEDTVLVFPVPPPPVPPSGLPTEIGTVQWPVKETDTDIALVSAPTTVVVGSVFLIDAEYMTVTDISNADNPVVTRATYGSVAAAHAAGAQVFIWGQVVRSAPPRAKAKAVAAEKSVSLDEPREETKKEEAKREREEERREEEAENRADARASAKSKKKLIS